MRRQTELSAAATEAAWVDGRTFERHSIRKHAILHYNDRLQTVLIRGISVGGMKIQNAFGLITGDVVRVELLTRRTFDGTVAWSLPPYCGIKFSTQLAENDPLLTTHALRWAQT
jgi:hypothetical protein